MTTEFERTRETADIALEGRDVPRLVLPELGDPPNGDLEQRPYAELARWREANGPDVPLPGSTGRSATTSRPSSEGSVGSSNDRSRPSSPILHGYVVSWITSACGQPGELDGTPRSSMLTAPELLEALDSAAGDVFRHWSWETSGRPLLFGADEDD